MSGDIEHEIIKNLKSGRFIIIDGVACRIVDMETSSPGKHGTAKVRLTGIGVFDGQKKTLLKPGDADVEVPIVKKKKGQIVSINGSNVQIMDTENYEVYELPIPEEFTNKLKAGAIVEVMEILERRMLSRVIGE
ncbi:MAG: translation initiation factor IF-5A [Candidatus Marsarchaeota archaeon]|jgi:translation initiation factor 5A|nr:translation initiation factor IF-5A [Candidatus Marsarchaeota archaeon]